MGVLSLSLLLLVWTGHELFFVPVVASLPLIVRYWIDLGAAVIARVMAVAGHREAPQRQSPLKS